MEKVIIYTDGACSGNPGPGGWAAILMYKDKQKEISGGMKNTTNNVMELTAVIEALKILKRPCKVNIYSDSAYVVNAFLQHWIDGWQRNNWKTSDKKDVKNKELWLELINLTKIHNITFHKVKGHADIYLLIVTASIPFIALYNGGAAIFRAMGNSQVSMRVSLLMNAINVTGNAILVFGLRIGTAGVAIPTLISRMVAAIVITVLLCNQTRILHIERTLKIRFDGRMIRKILAIGVPNGLENSMFQLGKILVLSLVSTFGTYAIAANAVSNAIALFQILPGMAISLAITTVISQCVGANDYEQVRYYLKKLLAIIYVAMVGTVALIFLALPLILKAYNLSDQTAAAATNIIHFHGISAMIIWPLSFALPAAYRAAGDAKACMYTSIVSMWIFRIGFSYLVGKYMGLGVFGVWVAMVIDWVVRAICFIIRYFNGKWKHGAIV